jgi:hypothetical protein
VGLMREITVHIEELVLRNVAPGDRDQIAAALGQELESLLASRPESPLFAIGGAIERLDGGALAAPARPGPAGVGVELARAVHTGLML